MDREGPPTSGGSAASQLCVATWILIRLLAMILSRLLKPEEERTYNEVVRSLSGLSTPGLAPSRQKVDAGPGLFPILIQQTGCKPADLLRQDRSTSWMSGL